jgi:hypothetical protein
MRTFSVSLLSTLLCAAPEPRAASFFSPTDAATAELRALVERRTAGLKYDMSLAALAPDDRLVAWVLEMAKAQ